MKISGARAEAFTAIRRRALTQGAAEAESTSAARAPDQTTFLGIPEAELTPAVQAALNTLLIEVENLRGEVARLKQRLMEAEGLADRDVLTPLFNRRAFVRELSRVMAYCERYGAAASVAYFDLDGLKAINDRFGHAAGDAALKIVAERLAGNVRETDIVGRLGGDEFAVILVQADVESAGRKAAALARVIEGEPAQIGDWSVPLHVSVGVREVTPGVDPEAALADADAAMYAAKRAREA